MSTLIQLWPVALGLVTGSFIARATSNFRQNRARRKRAEAFDAEWLNRQAEIDRQRRENLEKLKEIILEKGQD